MQISKIFITGLLCAWSMAVYAQVSLSGSVRSESGEPLPGATVSIKEKQLHILSDVKGVYSFEKIPPGTYTLSVSYVGHHPQEKEVVASKTGKLEIHFRLKESTIELQSATVVGLSETKEANRLAYNITAIDAKQLHNTTVDLTNVLDRVSGVRVRETGGVGSNFNFSLNGFSGRQVKFFIDGIPMDNFGSSFQLNNIPVNLAERIEIYKGVVPIWLGADALGGAVNIITNPNRHNYLDASYSFGSFNTHRTSVNTGLTTAKGLTFQLNAFQNYSDNNYWVNVEIADLETGRYEARRVRRFHDRYRNETVIANVGVVNKKFADRLLLGITLGKNQAEIQTGNRMYDVYGGRERKGNIVMPSLRYSKKDLFTKGLDVTLNGNFNLGTEQAIDTLFRQYNWLGEFIEKGAPGQVGGESSRTLYRFRNNNGLANLNINYQINEKHAISLNNTYNTFDRKGEDELNAADETNRLPKKTAKNVIGLGYRYQISDRLNATLFFKEYIQRNKSSVFFNNEYILQQNTFSQSGYGIATTYFVLPRLQLKGSFEKSYRLPENDEMFGDVINLASNINIRPETSYNFNLGVNYSATVNKDHNLYVDANLIYRSAADFIRPSVFVQYGRAVQQMVNLRDVVNSGIDGELRYSYKKIMTAGINLTYQNIRNNTQYEGSSTTVSPVYKDRIPNMPYLFGNANASVFLKNVGAAGNTLSVGYNLLYVHEYFLRWPSQGAASSKLTIPQQVAHDINLVYSLANGRYNIAFECRNIADAVLYDNFSLQKPSRSFSLKLRYFIMGY